MHLLLEIIAIWVTFSLAVTLLMIHYVISRG